MAKIRLTSWNSILQLHAIKPSSSGITYHISNFIHGVSIGNGNEQLYKVMELGLDKISLLLFEHPGFLLLAFIDLVLCSAVSLPGITAIYYPLSSFYLCRALVASEHH